MIFKIYNFLNFNFYRYCVIFSKSPTTNASLKQFLKDFLITKK